MQHMSQQVGETRTFREARVSPYSRQIPRFTIAFEEEHQELFDGDVRGGE